jgi:SAM domain (Sterile alpha motif)
LLTYLLKLHDELGVKALTDLPGLTIAQLSSIGMKTAEVTSFTAAVQALKAPTEPPPSTEPVVSAAQPGASGAKRKRPSAPSGACTGWSEAEVQQWLESRGLDHYAESFVLVEGSDLKGLTTGDLASLRPPIVDFAAKKLIRAIAELK